MPVYVIGHTNPDTDAICSALGYAEFLRKTTEMDVEAARCGVINTRTDFVLDRAGVKPPTLLVDVNPNAGRICKRNVLYAREDEPFLDVYRRMQQHRLRSIPVLDREHRVIGLLPLLNLLQLVLPQQEDIGESRTVHSSLTRVRNVLSGTFQHSIEPGRDEKMVMMIGAMSATGFTERLYKYPPDQIILLSGDRPTVHEPAIEYGVRCIVISGGYKMGEDLLDRAKAKGVAVLSTQYDTAMTSILIKSSRLISTAVEKAFVSFAEGTSLAVIRERVKKTQQDLFPVVDGDGKLEGVFSKSDLVNPKQTQLIMVDHNEFSQAVKGAADAKILQVLDHHRLGGGLVSREPIRFVNEVVGSTCTMVTRMFREKAIFPEPGIALVLASGIISDTLNLTSPTTTDVDRDLLQWLEPYTGTSLEEYARDFFEAGSVLTALTGEEVIRSDCKHYTEFGHPISASQVEELGMRRFWERKEDLEEALEAYRAKENLEFSCLLITDITRHFSLLLTVGNEGIIEGIDYPEKEPNLFELPGVVSRKKQLLPHLMMILEDLEQGE